MDREIALRPVDEHNRAQVLALRVEKSQQNFIETTARCLQEAAELALWRPLAVCAGETVVGFCMYGLWEKEGPGGRLWMDRLLIDQRYQGRGYGRAALRAVLRRMADEYPRHRHIYLSLYQDNTAATALYQSLGFVFTGERDHKGEFLMRIDRAQVLAL